MEVPLCTLALTGYVMRLGFVGPTTGTLTATGYAPSAGSDTVVTFSSPGTLAVTGQQPQRVVSTPGSATPAPGVHAGVVTGRLPGLAFMGPDTGLIEFEGAAPAVRLGGTWRETQLGALVVAGYAPTAVTPTSPVTAPPRGTAAFTGYRPTVGLATPPGEVGTFTLVIAGETRTDYLRRVQNIDINYTLGGNGTLRCELVDTGTVATAYRPAAGQPIQLSHGGPVLFSGEITSVEETPAVPPNVGVVLSLTATDDSRLFRQTVVGMTFSAGAYLGTVVHNLLVAYLESRWGVSMPDWPYGYPFGPQMTALRFDVVTLDSVFAALSQMTGWVYRMLPGRVLEWFELTTKTAAFSLTATNSQIVGGVRISRARRNYVNRVYLSCGGSTQVAKTETFTGDGTTRVFELTYPVAVRPGQVYDSATGEWRNVGVYGVDTVFEWVYREVYGAGYGASNELRQLEYAPPYTYHPPLPAGQTIQASYTAQFPFLVTREDAAEVALYGPIEAVVEAPDVSDYDAGVAMADGFLRRSKIAPDEVAIQTRAGFEFPGTTVTITVPDRLLSGSWLIVETNVRDLPDGTPLYTYRCIEGAEAMATWLDFWRQAAPVHTGGGGSIVGSITPTTVGEFTNQVDVAIAEGTAAGGFVRAGRMDGSAVFGPGLWLNRAGESSAVTGFSIVDNINSAILELAFQHRASDSAIMSLINYAPDWVLKPGSYPGALIHLGRAAAGWRWASINASVLDAQGPVRFTTDVTAVLTADANDWAPTGLANAFAAMVSSGAARTLTGISATGVADGQLLLLSNVGNYTITLVHQSASSLAANRFICPSGTNYALVSNGSCLLRRQQTRWMIITG